MFDELKKLIGELDTSTSNEIKKVAAVFTGIVDHLESAFADKTAPAQVTTNDTSPSVVESSPTSATTAQPAVAMFESLGEPESSAT